MANGNGNGEVTVVKISEGGTFQLPEFVLKLGDEQLAVFATTKQAMEALDALQARLGTETTALAWEKVCAVGVADDMELHATCFAVSRGAGKVVGAMLYFSNGHSVFSCRVTTLYGARMMASHAMKRGAKFDQAAFLFELRNAGVVEGKLELELLEVNDDHPLAVELKAPDHNPYQEQWFYSVQALREATACFVANGLITGEALEQELAHLAEVGLSKRRSPFDDLAQLRREVNRLREDAERREQQHTQTMNLAAHYLSAAAMTLTGRNSGKQGIGDIIPFVTIQFQSRDEEGLDHIDGANNCEGCGNCDGSCGHHEK